MKRAKAKSETNKEYIKKELRKLFRSIDFVSEKFLADEKAVVTVAISSVQRCIDAFSLLRP
jgi:hypothetical protein